MEEPEIQEVKKDKVEWRKLLWLWVKRIALFTFALFVSLSLLFQIPAVQNWTVKRVTRSLSRQLGTEVRVDHLNFAWFDRLSLNGFWIQDYDQDTLLFSRQLEVNFNLNPIILIMRGIEIERIDLRDAQLNMERPEGKLKTNLQTAIEKLFPPDTIASITKKRPIRLNLKFLGLDNVQFLKKDSVRGNNLAILMKRGRIQVNEMDLPNKRIAIGTADIKGLNVNIETYAWQDSLVSILDLEFSELPDSLLQDTAKYLFTVDAFRLSDGQFRLDNYRKAPVKLTPDNELDYKHMSVYDIQFNAECFAVRDWYFYGEYVSLSGKEQSGFELKRLQAHQASVTPKGLALYEVLLETPDSQIGDTLLLHYDEYLDWEDFVNKVEMEVYINEARVKLKDIVTFAPGLRQNSFFANNQSETLVIDGVIKGEVNDLGSRSLDIRFTNNNTRAKGRFDSRDLAVPNGQAMNLRLDYLLTNVKTLRQLIPNFNPPSNFDRLGRIDFRGRFDGFFVDFVAKGALQTSIGRAVIDDIRMNLKDGRERASYSGELKLINFDLGVWTQNEDLGTITLSSQLINGQGLTSSTASADVNAKIESFTYKGYLYENATLSGRLYEDFFNGDFAIQDDNVDFGFTGKVDLTDTLPRFDFNARVKKLDLKQLNLSQRNFVIKGTNGNNVSIDLFLRNASLSNLRGTLEMKDFTLVENDTAVYHIDSLYADSEVDSLGNKIFVANSDIVEAKVSGQFDIGQLPDIFLQYLRRNYPGHVNQWGLKIPEKELKASDFTYQLKIINSNRFNRLLDEKLDDIIGAEANGYYRSEKEEIKIDVVIPHLQYANIEWDNISVDLEGERDEGKLDLAVGSTLINGKQELPTIILYSILYQDTIDFALNYESASGGALLDDLTLNGKLHVEDSLFYKVQFNQSNLVILENIWAIDEDNSITFGNHRIETEKFVLTNQDRTIRLDRVGKLGLRLHLQNFDFDFIEDYWEYDPLDFSGKFDVQAEVLNMYELSGFQAMVLSDTFRINGDDWGQFQLNVNAADFKNPFQGHLTLNKDTSQLFAEGFFNPADIIQGATPGKLPDHQKANYFQFNVDVYDYPLWLARYFLGNTIENVAGRFNAALTFRGMPGRPKVDGHLDIKEAAITVSYLKTRYFIPQAHITADSTFFNASGNVLYDKYHNTANLFGGIRHNYLRDFRLDARLNTDGFLGVDTKKGDNKMFYGHILGRGDVRFTGSFQQPNIYVNAIVGDTLSSPAIPPTRLVIPVSYEREASELKFIKFVDKDAIDPGENNVKDPADLTGLSLEMDLSVTEEAQMEIIFDEQAGDIIKGSGNGNIRILMPRGGADFQMFGDYIIESGNYLFTLYGVASKEFRINEGGSINWNGDPFGAEINIEAQYKDLNASVATFIQEYIGSGFNDNSEQNRVVEEANQVTSVDLSMNLTGPLLQPIINFDIAFPDLTGRLKSYTDSKLRILKQDPNELNRQVFGLIVVGQFISSDLVSQGSSIIYNTVSEFVSNQLSLLLTELFSEFIADGRVLSGIDFDIAYNQYKATNLKNGEDFAPGDEIEVRLKQDFFNDRLSILVGGNVDFGGSTPGTQEASGAFVGNDVILEYIISKDRSLKMRFYQRLEPNITGRRLQVGTGLSFRKEYDSFSAFIQSLKKEGKGKG